MGLILYDMRMLSLISTATPDNSKVVIEHELQYGGGSGDTLEYSIYGNSFNAPYYYHATVVKRL